MKKTFSIKVYLLNLVLGFVLFPSLSFAAEPNYNCDVIKKQVLEASGVSSNSQFVEGLSRSSADENYVRKTFLPTFKQVYDGQKLKSDDPLYIEASKLFNESNLAYKDLDLKDNFKSPPTEASKRAQAAQKALNDFEDKHKVVIGKFQNSPMEVLRINNRKVLNTFLDGNRAAIELARKMKAFDIEVIGGSRYGTITEDIPKKADLDKTNFHRKVDLYEIVYPQTKGTKSKEDNVSVSMFESDDVRDRQWRILMHGSAFHIKCNSNDVEMYPEKCGAEEAVRHEKFCTMFNKIKKPNRIVTYPVGMNGQVPRLPFQSETVAPLRRPQPANENGQR